MKKIIFILVACLSFASCEKFLAESPKTFISPENYFTTEDQVGNAVWACYEKMMQSDCFGNIYPLIAEVLPAFKPSSSNEICNFTYTATTININKLWKSFYQAIGAANLVIDKVEKVSIKEEAKNCYLGEALFVRALCYFYMVQLWGDIPISLGMAANIDDLVSPRSSTAEVYAQIVEDLKRAEQLLPVENPYDAGRAKKISAAGLLGKVYCTMAGYPLNDTSKWELAKEQLLTIVDQSNPSKSTAAYKSALQANFQDLWYDMSSHTRNDENVVRHKAVENGVESVFEINYTGVVGYMATGYCNFPNTLAYKCNGKFSNWIFNYTRAYEPVEEYEKVFVPADPRYWCCIARNGDQGPDIPVDFYQIKFPRTSVTKDQAFDNNYPILRYSDLVLLLAEAENEINGPTELAKSCVNAVRARARNSRAYGNVKPESAVDTLTVPDGTFPADLTDAECADKETLRKWIHHERRVEFILEGGITWYDIVRWHDLKNLIDLQNKFDDTLFREYHEYSYLLPIPWEQIQSTNMVLTQNPGY